MIKTDSAKRLWDYCIFLEAWIRSYTVHGMYVLDGETTDALTKGKTVDISQTREFGWYEWVMFCDTPA